MCINYRTEYIHCIKLLINVKFFINKTIKNFYV